MKLALDGAAFRRLAAWGSQEGPEWFVRYSPILIGPALALFLPEARRTVLSNLVRLRGEASRARNALDLARTFSTYAGSFAESLRQGSKAGCMPSVEVTGNEYVRDVLAKKRGVVMLTAHTGGWEAIGPRVAHDFDLRVMFVMQRERDARAREVHDAARIAAGVELAHVDDDPLDALPLLRHLRENGAVGVQIDRAPTGKRARPVRFLGRATAVPEGPIRLAQLSGAPLLPTYCARIGFRNYRVEVKPPIYVPRKIDDAGIDEIAQEMANSLESFLRANPTQWFHFRDDDAPDASVGSSASAAGATSAASRGSST